MNRLQRSGGNVASPILLLGPVLFNSFEVPERINFGGSQRLAIHRLPGGQRVLDAMGRDDANIQFSGVFAGTDATLRARLVDELRASGATLPLTWDVFFYTVIVSQFRADYANSSWIPYTVTCTILRDEAGALLDQAIDLGAAVMADLSSAIGLASPAGVDLSGIQSALSDPSSTTLGTAAYGAAQSSVASAQSTLSAASSNASAALPMTDLTSAGTAGSGIGSLETALSSTQQMSQLSAAQAYVGRIASNLANAGS